MGEALKTLDVEDLLIEKGGVPVAVLSRYEPGTREEEPVLRTEYERSLSKRAEPGGIARMFAAMARGWVGIDTDALIADVARRREVGASGRRYSLDAEGDETDDDAEIPLRQ